MSSPGMSLSQAISAYQKGSAQHAQDISTKLGEAKKTYESRMADIGKEEASLDSGALKPPHLTAPPQPQETDPVHVWGSAAMWVAALGGLLTRRPLINSLNAASAVMNAYHARDAGVAKQAFDTWKIETENAVKMAQFSIDSYKAALQRVDTDKKAALADFTATAKALGDENAAYVAQHYGIDEAVRYVDAVQSHVDRMKMEEPKIDQLNTQVDLQLKAYHAAVDLAQAKKAGNPQQIQDAETAYKNANENLAAYKGLAALQQQRTETVNKKMAASAPIYNAAISSIDKAMATIKAHPSLVGATGVALRDVVEPIKGTIGTLTGKITASPAQDLEANIKNVQNQVRTLMKESKYMSASAVVQLDDQIQGLSMDSTPESALNSLAQIKDILNEQRAQPTLESPSADPYANMTDDEILKALGGQ